MINQVAEYEKHTRSEILLELAKNKKNMFIKRFTGQTINLLVEQKSGKDKYTGITDNYIEVIFSSELDLCGHLTGVKLLGADKQVALGQLCIE